MNAVCVDNEAVNANNTIDVYERQQITLSTAIEISVDTIHQAGYPPIPFNKILNRQGRCTL